LIRHFMVFASLFATVLGSADQPHTNAPRATQPAAERSAPERAWDDLRWLMTALEAYATDNDSLYEPAGSAREGGVSALDQQLEEYYANTFPRRVAPPRLDPWGREYRFVISETRRSYAIYSLGTYGKLDAAAGSFLERLKKDQVTDQELQKSLPSNNIVVSGTLIFAPAEVLRRMQAASERQGTP
jgi:hypothetical protein